VVSRENVNTNHPCHHFSGEAVVVLTKAEYVCPRLAGERPVFIILNRSGGQWSHPPGVSCTQFAVWRFVGIDSFWAFAIDTLDTCTSLAQIYSSKSILKMFPNPQPSFSKKIGLHQRAIVVVFSILLLASGEFTTLWQYSVQPSQLLAALAIIGPLLFGLIGKRKNALSWLIPMFFMFHCDLSILGLFAWKNFQEEV